MSLPPLAAVVQTPGPILLVGCPNSGKTTLFNALTGLRAKTANFPGTTVERREGRLRLDHGPRLLIDLPGLYGLQPTSPEEQVVVDALRPAAGPGPALAVVVVDATALERQLPLAAQALQAGPRCVVALTLSDEAARQGLVLHADALSAALGCPVVQVAARRRLGLDLLQQAMDRALDAAANPAASPALPPADRPAALREWAAQVVGRCVTFPTDRPKGDRTAQVDRALTHPLLGGAVLAGIMLALFWLIFSAADLPMSWLEWCFGQLADSVKAALGDGLLASLLADGLVAGVGGVVVFLPQILILFFLLSLLEDSGYLARASFVLERPMRAVGLSGKAFVPLLGAHACAIPAIMSTRVIDSARDRLVAVLVLPLASCSARLPVYTLLAGLLAGENALLAAGLFAGAYALGLTAVFGVAWLLKRTVVRGDSEPLLLELPPYRRPSLRNALWTAWDRGRAFLVRAGTVILALSIVLWWLSAFPRSDPPPEALALTQRAEALATASAPTAVEDAESLLAQAQHLTDQHQLAHSYAGQIGQLIEPVIAPLGWDWRIGVGVVVSFAAREAFASATAIVFGLGAGGEEGDLASAVRSATRPDGSTLFTPAVTLSLMVFYVLAMQCVSTTAIVYRETGGWAWPLAQLLAYTVLAYAAAWVAYGLGSLLLG